MFTVKAHANFSWYEFHKYIGLLQSQKSLVFMIDFSFMISNTQSRFEIKAGYILSLSLSLVYVP